MIAAALLVVAASVVFPAQEATGFSCPSALGEIPLETQASYLDSQAPGGGPGFRQFECFYRGDIDGETMVALVQANYDVEVSAGSECDPPGQTEVVEGGEIILHSLTHWANVRYQGQTTASVDGARELAHQFLAEAERRALPCDSEAAAPSTEAPSAPAPATTDEDEPTDEALTIAAGLILLLLGGVPLVRGRRPKPSDLSAADRLAQEQIAETLRSHADDLRPPPPPPPPPPEPPPEPPAQDLPPPDYPIEYLQEWFAAEVEIRRAEGRYVRNPDLIKKAWNNITDWDWTKGGQCHEWADWGIEWTKQWAQEHAASGAIVDKLVVHERSSLEQRNVGEYLDSFVTVNHAATRIILPDGRRYIVDFWEHTGRSWSGKRPIMPEEEWVKKWRQEIGEAVVQRSEEEQLLKKWVHEKNQDTAFAGLRKALKGTPGKAELIIKSWLRDPW